MVTRQKIFFSSLFFIAAILVLTVTSPLSAKKKRTKRRLTTAVAPKQNKKKSSNPSQKTSVRAEVAHILKQESATEDARIEFNFENAELKNLIDYMADLFDVSFITDDSVNPIMAKGKPVAGHKVTFRTEKPMTKKKAWDLFTVFLELAGLSIVKTPHDNVYRIMGALAANKDALPLFIGTDLDLIPNNDTRIRYITFLKNINLPDIQSLLNQLKSPSAAISTLVNLRGIIITDRAYNVKSMMRIIQELDMSHMPEMLSVVKLKYANPKDVKDIFDNLTNLTKQPQDSRSQLAQLFGGRKHHESFLFPKNTRLIVEARTNTLVLLGTAQAIRKIEEFIKKIDVEFIDDPSPLYIYELQHTSAESMANILSKVTEKGISETHSQFTAKPGEKYFDEISFTPEKKGNRLVIKGNYADYVKAKELIEKLDIMQPQVALEVMIVDVQVDKRKVLGAQLRNKADGTINTNVEFQNSGLIRSSTGSTPVIDTTTGSIMTNLINLATGNEAGSTLLTLGQTGDIWAIFKMLSTHSQTNIVSNPFLVTANKYTAAVELGETRRVVTGTVTSGDTPTDNFGDLAANLSVVITPQINSDGIITLDVKIDINEFTDSADPTSANQTKKKIETKVALANKEVLAIGGLIRTKISETQTKVPLLGDIPILGWFFKNKSKTKVKQNLLVFISPEIIQPKILGGTSAYTSEKADYTRESIQAMRDTSEKCDPVHRWFFKSNESNTQEFDDFMYGRFREKRIDMSQHDYYVNKTTQAKQLSPIKTTTAAKEGKE